MTTQEKLKSLIKDRGISLRKLHRKITDIFEDNAIAYLTLYRTVNGLTETREATLFQIAQGLGLSPNEMVQGTDRQESSSRYIYNNKAYYEIDNEQLPFLSGRLVLLPGAITPIERDPDDHDYVKWIYGLQGETLCCIETAEGLYKKKILRNERFSFKSTKPHHFENLTEKKASCVLLQYPRYI